MAGVADKNGDSGGDGGKPYAFDVRIPMETARYAEIMKCTFEVDKEVSASVRRRISRVDNVFVCEFEADDLKFLRTSVTSFFQMAELALKTIDQFDMVPPAE